jgi:hypothetical protein
MPVANQHEMTESTRACENVGLAMSSRHVTMLAASVRPSPIGPSAKCWLASSKSAYWWIADEIARAGSSHFDPQRTKARRLRPHHRLEVFEPGPTSSVKDVQARFTGVPINLVHGAMRDKNATAGDHFNLRAGLTARVPPILACGMVCR